MTTSNIYDLADTWTGGLAYTAIKMDVTDTSSTAGSALIDLLVGSSSKFKVTKAGIITTPTLSFASVYAGTIASIANDLYLDAPSANSIYLSRNNTNNVFARLNAADFVLGSNISFGFSGTAPPVTLDTILTRDAANTLAQRNSTAGQWFRIYNTYTDASNYERLDIAWSGSSMYIQTRAQGTGATTRAINISADGLLSFGGGQGLQWQVSTSGHLIGASDNTYDFGAAGASRPRTAYLGTSLVTPLATITQGTITADAPQINGTVTWNNAGVTFTGWKLNVTSTASAAASKLVDFQLASTSLFSFGKNSVFNIVGTSTSLPSQFRVAGIGLGGGNASATGAAVVLGYNDTDNKQFWMGDPDYLGNAAGVFARFGSFGGIAGIDAVDGAGNLLKPIRLGSNNAGVSIGGDADVILIRDAAADILALRRSTTAQEFRVYNTYTDASNYERATIKFASNIFKIVSEAAGTGTTRNIIIESAKELKLIYGGGQALYFENANAGYAPWSISTGNALTPGFDADPDIGTASLRVRKVYMAGTVTPKSSTLTIATGAMTVTGSYHDVETEGAAASDDLDTINGGVGGMRLVLRATNSARTVVVKDGTGNIQCAGDCSLDNIQDIIELIYDSVQTAWLEISRSDNGA